MTLTLGEDRSAPVASSDTVRSTLWLSCGPDRLGGDLAVPPEPKRLVIFAHGSGSSRFSPRNRRIAAFLNTHRFATLLLDLLTPEEDLEDRCDARSRFNIPRLAGRLSIATARALDRPELGGLPVGYFGASTGAAAALVAASFAPEGVAAIVSRGGRPDLAGTQLAYVRAPTLLIVGERDREVLTLNELARARMTCPTLLSVIGGATHLFEEPGTLDEVSEQACSWFERYLVPRPVPVSG